MRWTIGCLIGRMGWWLVGIGAAIAWDNHAHYPWHKS